MRYIWDLESNGFLETLTKIHCIAMMNADDPEQTWVFGPNDIKAGMKMLAEATEIIGHNILCHDIPALMKVYPKFSLDGVKITDTLVLSRLIKPDLFDEDFARNMPIDEFPRKYYGSHSLKAWGFRTGQLKGDFGEQTDWSEWTQGMQDYCQNDVVVNYALWRELTSVEFSQRAIDFEHKMAEICHRIGNAGWHFDVDKAGALYAKLAGEKAKLEAELKELFPPWTQEEMFIPKRNNKRLGYIEGEPFIKKKEITFNPNSRKHIHRCLVEKYGWKPKAFTTNGDAKIDEAVLTKLPYPEAQKLARSFLLQKRIGMLAEGNQAYLRLVEGRTLRHVINSCGAVTGRCTHFNFNAAQVPSVRAPYGVEFRSLFGVPDGYSLVGADLSGIELRCLANVLQDRGKYADIILNGDIHTANQHDMKLATRDMAKTAIYCMIYGGGDARLGEVVGKGAKEGRELRNNFMKANPAFADLTRQLKQVVARRGHLIGLDGRRLHVRGHAQLNVLLQSAAALVAKKWVQIIDQEIRTQGLDAKILSFVHDEVQIQVIAGKEQQIGDITSRASRKAGEHFGFSIPIESEYKIGKNWAETH